MISKLGTRLRTSVILTILASAFTTACVTSLKTFTVFFLAPGLRATAKANRRNFGFHPQTYFVSAVRAFAIFPTCLTISKTVAIFRRTLGSLASAFELFSSLEPLLFDVKQVVYPSIVFVDSQVLQVMELKEPKVKLLQLLKYSRQGSLVLLGMNKGLQVSALVRDSLLDGS